ncbi:MAG TPA: alpha/beta hydrolase [Aldersonia sp.]
MSLALSDLRAWRPDALIEAAQLLTDLESTTQTISDTARDRIATDAWDGRAAAAAAAAVSAAHRDVSRAGVGVLACIAALHEAAATLHPAVRAALGIADEARAAGCTVTDSGEVVASVVTVGDPVLDLLFADRLRERAQTLRERLEAALQAVTEVDAAAADRLRGAATQICELASGLTSLRESVRAVMDGRALLPADPVALAGFWSDLSPTEKDALATWDPAIGNRDGLPAGDRDHYNRRYLDLLAETAARDLAALDARRPEWAQGQNIPPDQSSRDMRVPTEAEVAGRRAYDDWSRERDALRTVAAGYAAVHTEVIAPDRHLLAIDTHGRVAIATHNPDFASHVATFVPGTGTKPSTIGTDTERAQRMSEAAQTADSGSRVAVVTWYGYPAPPTLLHAASDGYADDGAERLHSFQDGLRAAHLGPPAHTTVVGHSYGTLVVGAAATSVPFAADDLVLVGSPGIDVARVEDLRLAGVDPAENHAHVYATASSTDPIPYVGDLLGPVLHGVNPVRDDFGATVFDSGPGEPARIGGIAVSPLNPGAHSGYWEPGSVALTNLGRIIAGLTPSSAPPG